MAGMADIKRRIKSVSSTKQITKAMELVATSKLRRAKDLAIKRSEYTNAILEMISLLSKYTKNINSPYFKASNTSASKLYIVLSGDKGLAGGFNSNVIKTALADMSDIQNTRILAYGVTARDYFKKNNFDLAGEYVGVSDNPNFANADTIATTAMSLFTSGNVSEINLVYSKFNSVLSQTPKIVKLLPIGKDFSDTLAKKEQEGPSDLLLLEPDGDELLSYLIPKYLTSVLYGAMIDNYAGEQAARRFAMSAATDNANDLIEELGVKYNTARQASITNEIIEIVSGAEASK